MIVIDSTVILYDQVTAWEERMKAKKEKEEEEEKKEETK